MRALAALTLSWFAFGAAAGDQAAQVFQSASPSVFSIGVIGHSGDARVGSGVAVEAGRVVTNFHVVRDARNIYIKQGERSYEAQLETRDEKHDLALLQVTGLDAPVPELAAGEALAIGQSVYAIGSPRGLELTLSEGIVSSLRQTAEGKLIQTTAPISPGSSGGGLFDGQGRLVGLTTAQVINGQNLNFAIPVERLAGLGLNLALSSEPAPASAVVIAAPRPMPAEPATAVVAAAAEAAVPEPEETGKKGSGGSLLWASVLIAILVFGAKPAIRWLSDYLADGSLPAPAATVPGKPRPPPVDRLAPYRAAAREEFQQSRDESIWQSALLKAGGDEAQAAVEYVEERAYARYRADLDRKWAEAQAQNQAAPSKKA